MLFHCFTSACDPGGRRHDLNIVTLESSRPSLVLTPSPRAVPAPSASPKRLDNSQFDSKTKKHFHFDSTLQHRLHSSTSIKRLVTNVLLDYRRSLNTSSTSTRAASTTTSCCCPLLLHRRRRRLLDFIDVPSTPKGPTLLVLASTTSRQRQARQRATAASLQCSRRHLRNR